MSAAAGDDIVRVAKAGEMVAAHLRRQIVAGRLQEGAVLPSETALMEQFGISRPTVREAFRILESESIITVRRGAHGGARVLAPDGSAAARYAGLLLQHQGALLADVYEARTILEVSSVGTLATRRGKAHLAELDALADQGAELVADGVGFADHDARFHQAVVRLAGNETISMLTSMLYYIIAEHNRRFVARHVPATGDPQAPTAQRAHERLLAQLAAHDAEGARRFWRHHLDLVAEYMVTDPATTVVEVLS